jgi:Rrf2 family protein
VVGGSSRRRRRPPCEEEISMSSLLKVSEAGSLAIHATAVLAGAQGARVTARRMAAALGVSEAHLAKVLQRLTRAGLVRGTRGPRGGYRLTRPARQISLREVYEAVEGSLEVERCLLGVPVCGQRKCPVAGLFERLGRETVRALGKITLNDFRVSFETECGGR